MEVVKTSELGFIKGSSPQIRNLKGKKIKKSSSTEKEKKRF